MAGTEDPSGALLLEDRELRLFLLLLDLDGTGTPEAMAQRVGADLQSAWALRSACLPTEGRGLPGAALAWRVRVQWLGQASQTRAWRASILHARQRDFVLEEIPVDAAFAAPSETPEQCLDRLGLPGLLLTARGLFRKDAAAAARWTSADRRVREALGDLEAGFREPRPRELARAIQAMAQAPDGRENLAPPAPPTRITALTVQEVRGVRDLTLTPWPGDHPVQAWVLGGPNGSGKSSLAEAVAMKAFGTSRGLCAYLRDPDVTRARTPEGYVAQYLPPLHGGAPRCAFDGTPAPFRPAPDLALALEALTASEGTLAAQGDPGGFLDTPGDELGARMARSFSALATRITAYVESNRHAAGEARTALARKHGISASTRLPASFQDKIARGLLAPAFAPLPPLVAEFLACRAILPGGGEARLVREAWAPGRAQDDTLKVLMRPGHGGRAELLDAVLPTFKAQEARGRAPQEHLAAFRQGRGPAGAPPWGYPNIRATRDQSE
jgi:hypothetical protein